jgi:hypothetical protein
MYSAFLEVSDIDKCDSANENFIDITITKIRNNNNVAEKTISLNFI